MTIYEQFFGFDFTLILLVEKQQPNRVMLNLVEDDDPLSPDWPSGKPYILEEIINGNWNPIKEAFAKINLSLDIKMIAYILCVVAGFVR